MMSVRRPDRNISVGKEEGPKAFDRKLYSECVIHLIDPVYHNSDTESSDEDSERENRWMSDYITSQIPELWSQMRCGDLIEDVSQSGYRSDGVYVVTRSEQSDGENLVKGGLEIASLYYDYDDYGTVPTDFYLITKFPLGYHDYSNMVVNNTYAPTHSGPESYWHFDPYLAPLDLKKLKLDSENLELDNIFQEIIDMKEKTVNISFVVLTYKKQNYMILTKNDPNDFIESLSVPFVEVVYGEKAIDIMNKSKAVQNKMKKILEEHEVPVANLLLI